MTRVRPATSADIPALIALERASSTAAHWSEPQYSGIFEPGGPERVALVAAEEAVLGFIVAQVIGDEWEIENVVVAAAARRRGLGRLLVSELVERARRRAARNLQLEVRESNHAARRLYESSGFQLAGRRKAYYADPVEDALLFRLGFPQQP